MFDPSPESSRREVTTYLRNNKKLSLIYHQIILSSTALTSVMILFQDKSTGKYCAEEKNIMCSIQPEAGLTILFNHHRLHEGAQLKYGPIWTQLFKALLV